MAVVQVHATGEEFDVADGPLLDYYRGEANTVGGYTIDGAEYPRRIALSSFDPGDHTVDEVQEHLAVSMPAEQARVIEAERAGQARVTLLREYELPEASGDLADATDELTAAVAAGGPMTAVEHPADGTWSPEIGNDPEPDHPSPKPH